jgi:hypothetical protein
MATGNPRGDTDAGQRRALELAAGRVGVSLDEYHRFVDGDEELESLEAAVLDAARNRPQNL